MTGIAEILTAEAGKNALEDRYMCGYIAAFNDALRSEPDFLEESE